MIFEHDNYRDFLRSTFAEKSKANKAFSLRAFARHIKISPSMLSEVMRGKKHLSQDMAHNVSKALYLTSKEKDYFYNLILLEKAKNADLKIAIEKKINRLRPQRKLSNLSLDTFKYISDPNHAIILEMAGIDNIKLNYKSAALATGTNEIESQIIIERLERLGLLKQNGAFFAKNINDDILVKSDRPNAALRAFHKKMLEKAIISIEEQTPKEKFIGSETFAFSEENLAEATEIIEDCFSKILLLSKNTKNKNAIYHLGIQLFNLTKKRTF